jgi:hypothetical protein
VKYLLGNYGQDKMLDILTILKHGSTYDEALTEVYGFDIEGFDAAWRATLTNPVALARKAGLHPVRLGMLTALGVGLVTWGVVALRRRTKRKAAGPSTM